MSPHLYPTLRQWVSPHLCQTLGQWASPHLRPYVSGCRHTLVRPYVSECRHTCVRPYFSGCRHTCVRPYFSGCRHTCVRPYFSGCRHTFVKPYVIAATLFSDLTSVGAAPVSDHYASVSDHTSVGVATPVPDLTSLGRSFYLEGHFLSKQTKFLRARIFVWPPFVP